MIRVRLLFALLVACVVPELVACREPAEERTPGSQEEGGGRLTDDETNEPAADVEDLGGDEGEGSAEEPTSAFLDLLETLARTPEDDRQALVDSFFENISIPYVEGEVASFLYRDATAATVRLAGDHTGWDFAPDTMARVAGTDLFHLSYVVPADARLDYKLIVDGTWILDPENPHRCPSGFGDNSELRMPAWAYPAAIDFVAQVPHGAVNGVTVNAGGAYPALTLHSSILNDDREVFLYTPPGYDPLVAYPLLVVNDGGDYLRLARMPFVLDNLIAAGTIESLVVAFVSPVDRRNEYVESKVDAYVQLMDSELLPFVEERVTVTRDRARRAVMGTSFGGYISMRLARDLPHRFGMFAAQSGILLYDGGAALGDLDAASSVKAWLDTGLIGDATEDSRAARDHFASMNLPFAYLEVNEGHSWGSWRGRLDDILTYLFPHP